MSSYPTNKWIRGLNTFLACAVIVMLGGTRTLDNRSYNNAHLFLRTLAIQLATHYEYAGESAWDVCYSYIFSEVFADSDGGGESLAADYAPMWHSADGGARGCGRTWLIQDSMPLQYIVASYHQPDMMTSEALFVLSSGRTSWVTDVPTPPPKFPLLDA